MPVDWITAIVSAAIDTPAVMGLSGFLGRRILQRQMQQHNRQLEQLKATYVTELEKFKDELDRSKRMLQAEIDKTVLVTKVHFQTEFDALKQVFEKLADLKFQMCGLHPTRRIVRENETKEERLKFLKAQMIDLYKAYDALLMASEHLRPFYPQEIYEFLRQCLKSANDEDTHLKLSGPETFTFAWSQRGEENVRAFLTSYDAVADLIRERISKLAILPAV